MLSLSRHDVARLLVRPYPVCPFACLPIAHLSVCPPQHRNRINMKAKNSSRYASNCKERKNIRTDGTPSVAGMPAKEGDASRSGIISNRRNASNWRYACKRRDARNRAGNPCRETTAQEHRQKKTTNMLAVIFLILIATVHGFCRDSGVPTSDKILIRKL